MYCIGAVALMSTQTALWRAFVRVCRCAGVCSRVFTMEHKSGKQKKKRKDSRLGLSRARKRSPTVDDHTDQRAVRR